MGALEELVGRTAGLQPWRKILHGFSGLVIAAGLTFLELSKPQALMILGGIGVLLLIGDAVRLMNQRANELFFRSFSSFASPRESTRLASSTWYTFGALVVVAIAPRPEAVSGVLVLALADPTASVVGQLYGRRPFLGGSVEGTATFLCVSLLLLLPRHAWPAAVAASVAATLVERRSWPLDDNFAVPVVTGLVLFGMATVL